MEKLPWYKTTYRWAQTNITEKDPIRYDVKWWSDQWKRTHAQGVIINAGGIVTYYPSKLPFSFKSPFLGERDLLGELVAEARKEGLVVIARMDSNRVDEQFYLEHPDWIATDINGKPYKVGDKYITCIHSPYYSEYLPAVLVEIGEKYHVEGYADNSYSGLHQGQISYSKFARERFKNDTGLELPTKVDWDDPTYQKWIRWSYKERTRIWDLNNKTIQDKFGPDCLWIGMISGHMISQTEMFRDAMDIGQRVKIIMLDHQSRTNPEGFRQNIEAGIQLHELSNWDILIPESTAMYQHAPGAAFRMTAKPLAESKYWTYSGYAGGIQPWWHHIAAYHDDRRAYKTPLETFGFHAENEKYLVNRKHIASAAVVYSTNSIDFYGRDKKDIRFKQPYEGAVRVLSECNIPYTLIHIDKLPEKPTDIKLMVFPNIGALSDSEVEKIKRYIKNGGSVVFSGETGAYDENGKLRDKYPFEDVFGIKYLFAHHGSETPSKNTWASWDSHTYVRLHPENRGAVDGPRMPSDPVASTPREEILKGFDETDIIPFGGRIECVDSVCDKNRIPLTFVPAFEVFPPEFSWMKYPDSSIPAVILRESDAGGRLCFMPCDFDRQYAFFRFPDHKNLLGNIYTWALGDKPVELKFKGDLTIDTHLFEQDDNYVMHVMNFTNTDKPVVTDAVTVHDIKVRVKLPKKISAVHLLVAKKDVPVSYDGDYAEFSIDSIDYHEVCVLKK